MKHCEFCQEFEGNSVRFGNLYGHVASSRIIARTDRFVALPTLGQLFAGSLLVLPLDHVEACAFLQADARDELAELTAKLTQRVREFGEPVVFEHGSTELAGGSCGIYHAHLHIVPLPQRTEAAALFPEYKCQVQDVQDAWANLQEAQEYLLMSSAGQTLYSDLSEQAGVYPSQFFRRRIVEYFGLDVPWDWRAFNGVEAAMLKTLGLKQVVDAR